MDIQEKQYINKIEVEVHVGQCLLCRFGVGGVLWGLDRLNFDNPQGKTP